MSALAGVREYLARLGLTPLKAGRTRRGAQLRIEFAPDGQGNCGIRLRIPGSWRSETLNALPWVAVAAARDRLSEHLYDFVRAIQRPVDSMPDWSALNAALAVLDEQGRSLMFDLLTPTGGVRLRDVLRKVSVVAAAREPFVDYPPVLIELHSAQEYVHLEGLPLVGVLEMQPVTDGRSFRAAMWRLLGMFAIIRRTGRSGTTLDSRLSASGRLPIKVFYDASLSGAKDEIAFFQTLVTQVSLEGPWPDAAQAQNCTSASFAAMLLNPDQNFDGTSKSERDQILHFSCHCVTDETDPNRYRLRLRAATGESVDLTLQQLRAAFFSQQMNRPLRSSSRPLVFFNACGSAAIDPHSLGSFPALFAATHRGMIGTETKIPDDVAAAFSKVFYTALLGGRTVGQSLQAARWALVNRLNSPLGILYTLHADPDLFIDFTDRS